MKLHASRGPAAPGRRWNGRGLGAQMASKRPEVWRAKKATRGQVVLVGPSESSVTLLALKRRRLKTSSQNWLLVQSFAPTEVPRSLVPRSHHAVGHFLGWVVFLQPAAPTTLSDQCILSSSFAFLQSLAQRNLVRRPEPANSSHGLSLPSAHQGSEVHLSRVCLARYVPSTGFGYPLDGLLPPSPCRFCFTPAALLGFTLRSFPLSKGIRLVSGRKNPPAVSLVGAPAAEAMGRPNKPRLLGFHPSESPWRPDGC